MKLFHGHVQLPGDDEQLARLEVADPGLNLRARAGVPAERQLLC